jgi:hypothetical protein
VSLRENTAVQPVAVDRILAGVASAYLFGVNEN